MPYIVEYLETELPVKEYMERCVDVERFLEFCKECRNYNSRWSCPPFPFQPLQLWSQFERLHLSARVLHPSQDETLPALLERMWAEKAKMMAELLDREKKLPHALVLSAGGCSLCGDECTRPCGSPCRKPGEMRYSIDALGGDIGKTMELYFHRPIVWSHRGEVPAYLTLMGGLLVK